MIEAEFILPRLFAEGSGQLAVQLTLAPGSLTALVGASGSGKTTLLRLLAGLETPRRGRMLVDGEVWTSTERGINRRPQERSVGYIFQDAALFPHLTVRENIRFVTPRGNQALADELMAATDLHPFADQKPARLSGGQRQRVALVRTLVRRPKLLLLDEPFSALDAPAAEQLRTLLHKLHLAWETTTLLVSHHVADVQSLANRVVTLSQGVIVSDEPVLTPSESDSLREPIRNIHFDTEQGLWVLETPTMQLRSANPYWGQLRPGQPVTLSIGSQTSV